MKYSSTSLVITVLLVLAAVCGVIVWNQSEKIPAPQAEVSAAPSDGAVGQPSGVSEDAAEPELVNAVPLPAPTDAVEPDAANSQDLAALPDHAAEIDPDAVHIDSPDEGDTPLEAVDLTENPEASGLLQEDLTPEGKKVVTGTVTRGDTAAVLLNTWLPSKDVYALIETTRKVYPLAKIREGQPYTLVYDPQKGEIESFEYEIDSNQKLIISSEEGNYAAKLEDIEYETRLAKVEGVINSNLFQAMTDAGEQPGLVMLIANIFAWEINFIKDIREGDSFSILVEKRYRDGEFRNYGKVLGATFTNQKKTHEAFRFTDAGGHQRFFTAKGESLEKTLLKAPLAFTRVTSGYSMNRLHPIFKNRRPHQGIDYGAPAGTPIMAVGRGTVSKVGWVGGYGKQVVIRHSGKLESMYSHMSRYARGIKPGVKVRQGQIIGYVGSTGNATGPHLDFRLRQNGAFINPGKAINPRVDDLEKKLMASFSKQVALVRDYMEGKKLLAEYHP